MPNCLLLTPYPLLKPKHGGQVRAAAVAQAARRAGWHVDSVGVFSAAFFPPEEWGPHDIVLDDEAVAARALGDMLFADFHVARAAAQDSGAVDALRVLIRRLAPDVVHVEQPWGWLVLREALPPGHRIKVIYSSQNLEWRARLPLFRLGMRNAGSEDMTEATRLLEEEFARSADLVLSISDIEQEEIERRSGRPVVYLPAAVEMPPAAGRGQLQSRFAAEARKSACRYAALMGSAYWPNVEGFFGQFTQGLGFLAMGEQVWVAGTLARAIRDDARYQDFLSINESRARFVGHVADEDKADFFQAAACVIVPVTTGAGAKLKTADAILSGRPVIATPHALEGYGPVVEGALGRGVYEAGTPAEFRRLIREALRHGLPGCRPEIRARLGMDAMSANWARHANALLEPAAAPA
ncbi:MAG: glycosyltransferase [Acetobacteraceae bacterium]|nr:glycosyltransferase [Acetobacteraceae bacterium]